MKEIMAIIRMNRINQTKKALVDAGFPCITCRKVLGRGKNKVVYELLQGVIVNSGTSPILKGDLANVAEQLSESHTLMPKRLITLVVKDSEKQKVVDTIVSVNSKGHPGDGKIFIFDIEDAVRVRTGERGEAAL